MNITKFEITNLDCGACVKLSVAALQDIPGVKKASVNLSDGLSYIESEEPVEWQSVSDALKKIGKNAKLLS